MNAFFARSRALQKTKPKKPKGRRESEVQAGIMAYLDIRPDVWAWRVNVGGAFLHGFFVKFGVKGAPDIHGLQAPEGRFFVVECKREKGGGLSEDQKRWRHNFIAAGGLYIGPARGVEIVEKGLGPIRARFRKLPMRRRAIRRE